MPRKSRSGLKFRDAKMLSSRVEKDLFMEFEKKIRYENCMDLQEVINIFVQQFVSGTIQLSGTKFTCGVVK